MPRASEIKRGQVVENDGAVFAVRHIERSAPTTRGGGTESISDGLKGPTVLIIGATPVAIQLPDYITPGEKVRVNTESREFMSRA